MGIGMLPIETVPVDGRQSICATCANPEHGPRDKTTDHPFTVRVRPVGFIAATLPDACPVCSAPVAGHHSLDINLACDVIACDPIK